MTKRMNRTLAVFAIALALFASHHPAAAQQGEKVYRIGFLTTASAKAEKQRLDVFRQGLKALGYVEGRNIVIEERYGAGRRERLPELAAELVRLEVDVIVTRGGVVPRTAETAAKEAGRTIAIVMAVHADPVGTGVVASLAQPGGVITGLTDSHGDLVGKRLELLKEVVPSASRIAVLWNPATTNHPPQWKQIQAEAPALGLTLLSLEVENTEDFDRALAGMRMARPDGLVVFGHSSIARFQNRTVKFALKNRLPTIFTGAKNIMIGGLMSYGVNFHDMYRRAATFVDKILRGAKPADLPVEQPTRFYLTINLKTAKALGITFPRSILLRATEVIE
jgi:putative ABC transport system substrate-binding protein